MHGTRKLVLVLVAAVLAACQTQDQASEQGSEVTTPAVDEAAVRQAIEANDAAFEQAFTAGDAAALGAFYTEDAVVLPPNAPRVEGPAGIQEAFGGMMEEAPGATLDLTTEDVRVAAAGDYAYAVGSYTMSGTAPDGTGWTDEGKYVVVWKNVDGQWKMVVDAFNSDNPPPGAAADESAPAGEPAE